MAFLISDFSSWVADLTVSGVVTKRSSYPSQISTSLLPLSYPRLPVTESGIVTIGHTRGLVQATVDLVIIVEPVRQNLNSVNYEKCLDLIDALTTALTENASARGIDSWSILLDVEEYGEATPFWTLVARVSGSGT